MQSRSRRTAVALGLTLGLGGISAAQAPSRFESVEVALWPEYDRPTMLVILRLVLDSGVPLPATLAFTLPASAGVPNAVAERVGDQLLSLPYERSVSGEMARLSFVANSPVLQIEYYDPGLTREGQRRRFNYEWLADYAAGSLSVVVQHPAGASDVLLEPPGSAPQMGADSLRYQRVELGTVAAGDGREVAIEYERQAETLTRDALPPPAAPASGSPQDPVPTGASTPTPNMLLMVVLVLGLAGLVIGLLLRQRARWQGSAGTAATAFCTRCGKGAASGDRFCGKCGARLPGR